MQKIILSGYMGSGKSTVGKSLSLKTGFKWLDLDSMIEEEVQLSISDIFKNKGELYFRKTEHEVLSRIMDSDGYFILSLGGGTPCYSNNLELLKRPQVSTFYLKASVETLITRINNQLDFRPLLSQHDNEDLREYIAKHLFERSAFYNEAQYKVDTDNKTPDDIASEIMQLLV